MISSSVMCSPSTWPTSRPPRMTSTREHIPITSSSSEEMKRQEMPRAASSWTNR